MNDFDFEQFILDSLKKNMRPPEMVLELKKRGIIKKRKSISNKIGSMRTKGIKIPLFKEPTTKKQDMKTETIKTETIKTDSSEKETSAENPVRKFKAVEVNICLTPLGMYKVSKRIDGKSYQRLFKSVEEARTYRDSLVKEPILVQTDPAVATMLPPLPIENTSIVPRVTTEAVIINASQPKRSALKKEPKLSNLAMSDIFEKDEKFVVIISKDKNIITTLIDKMLR